MLVTEAGITPWILVVEDDSATRQILLSVLRELPEVEVREAGDAAQALRQLAAANPPALIVTDLMLPGLDGETFIRAVRVQFGPDVPIMLLSALPLDIVRAAATRTEAKAYLTKPFELGQFLEQVRGLLPVSREARNVPGPA